MTKPGQDHTYVATDMQTNCIKSQEITLAGTNDRVKKLRSDQALILKSCLFSSKFAFYGNGLFVVNMHSW